MKALHTYNPSKDNFTFCYYDTDHLGNVRQVRKVNRSRNGEVVQTNNYYPFGAEFCDNTASNSVQSRKYNGKEFDRMHGLNTYDYGARQYNPVTARWDRVDPLAHEYYSISPYVYCMNNPVKFVDPDGRIIDSASVSQNIKNMIDPSHDCFNAEFADIYNYLDNDRSTTYRFEQWTKFRKNGAGQEISGNVTLSSDRTLIIGYSWGIETMLDGNLAPERALFEEVRHAKQFCDGEFGFFRTPGSDWLVCGNVDENEAHAWAARVSGSTPAADLSYYSIDKRFNSAKDFWVNDNRLKRKNTAPKYDSNGLYSSEYWYFKKPKMK